MHGNPEINKPLPLNTVFISKNHAIRHNSNVYVYNGLNWNDYPEINLNKPRKHFHFLAKASWKIKNLAGAAEIAVKAKQNLVVLGGSRYKFYNFKRSPMYTLNYRIKYKGMVDNFEKIKYLEESKGLIFPVLWDEPFGLAIIESLYAGCPIYGANRGSITEIVTKDVGFLSNNYSEIINAMNTMEFTAENCHKYAKLNFNSNIMATNYLKLYSKILNGENLHTQNPIRTI